MSELYFGRGNASMRDDYLDFINLVFGFNGNDRDFLKMYPNLYKAEYDPCYNNFIALEDGKFRAAIGVYPRTFAVLDETVVSYGIGNVAVHPYHRRHGYMRKLMDMAIADMIAAGADFSDLGGQRQRYAYWGYEPVGPVCKFHINGTNLRHAFPGAAPTSVYFEEVRKDDPILDRIMDMQEQRISRTVRCREHFYDTVCACGHRPYAIYDAAAEGENRFLGYCLGTCNELTLIDQNRFEDVIRASVALNGEITLHVPMYETEWLTRAYRLCESVDVSNSVHIAVFHFEKMVRVFAKLKAATVGMADGCRQYRIHGVAGDESFRLTVKDNTVETSAIDPALPVIELGALEATAYFFANFSPDRMTDPLAATWFALPLHISGCDHV